MCPWGKIKNLKYGTTCVLSRRQRIVMFANWLLPFSKILKNCFSFLKVTVLCYSSWEINIHNSLHNFNISFFEKKREREVKFFWIFFKKRRRKLKLKNEYENLLNAHFAHHLKSLENSLPTQKNKIHSLKIHFSCSNRLIEYKLIIIKDK